MTNLNNYHPDLKERVYAERSMLMLPMNVIMSANVSCKITLPEIKKAVSQLRKRHAYLAVRVSFDKSQTAWYETDSVPEIPVNIIEANGPDVWDNTIKNEWITPFNINKGPLIRITVINYENECDLIITGHHIICDGNSLALLIRDLMMSLYIKDYSPEVLPPPLPINENTVPSPMKIKPVMKSILNLMNNKWNKQNICFTQNDMERMHNKFWAVNSRPIVLRWNLNSDETEKLVKKCREEKVTVNSALWTVFLLAQDKIQGNNPAYRKRAGMAVSTREKLTAPQGDVLGFFASSLSLSLKYSKTKTFWDSARIIHKTILKALDNTDIFRMLIAEYLPSTLLDSFYFQKYDGLKNRMANNMLRKMNWHKISYGYSITNVGKLNIPADYNGREIKAVYGPLLYSDVNEKVVGIITVGNKLTFSFTCNGNIVDQKTAEHIKETAAKIIKQEV